MNPVEKTRIHAVVSGSFRKHLPVIQKIVQALRGADIEVLAPRGTVVASDDGMFVLLENDDSQKSPARLEEDYLEAIMNADMHFIANVDGYIGQSAGAEMAFAILHAKPVYRLVGDMCFSDNIPETVRKLLIANSAEQCSLSEIYRIHFLFKKHVGANRPLSEDDQSVLLSFVNDLINELKMSYGA